jgi:hypothetical protein
MSNSDPRSRYIWRAGLIPLLCVIMFVIAAMIVVVAYNTQSP